jgi:hypothetical protein
VSTGSGGDVVAGLPALASFAGTRREPFTVALHTLDGIGRARLLVGDGVVAKAVNVDAGFDFARFVNDVGEVVGCGELNNCVCSVGELLTRCNYTRMRIVSQHK